MVKLNASGVIEWQKTIGGFGGDILTGIQQTRDGGYILGGYTYSQVSGEKTEYNRGGHDYWIVKLSSSGGIEWDKTIGGISYDDLYSIEQTSDGGYILGGSSDSDRGEEKRKTLVEITIIG